MCLLLGYSGSSCEFRVDEVCRRLNCSRYGGRCIRLEPWKKKGDDSEGDRERGVQVTFEPKQAVCACPDGFVGDTCEERSNSCKKLVILIFPNI